MFLLLISNAITALSKAQIKCRSIDFFYDRCRAFSTFFFFNLNKSKIGFTAQFIMLDLVNMRSLIRIRCKDMEIWELKPAKFYNKLYARGNAFCTDFVVL